ncbi:hypothetical protein J422_00245 [Methanocaldococcus villosus KIN24-T80]|uniref:Uncharacterized protein n=1 Tax=Methanocaldococcus villosus KIN24-T80 TaxID=1069083 RepID=N6VSI0_9EURY|nr:CheF family chemotaxis protein [Methanocaldococcus villosus]ENN96830.1 hypothetical protein J422_00245 [Methanocaldococcus villosus KIN24-T80]
MSYVAKFSGRGVVITKHHRKLYSFLYKKWEPLDITLYRDKIVFDFGDNKIELSLDNIIDIGERIPEEIIKTSKYCLEGIEYYSTVTTYINFEKTVIAFATESMIYEKTLIISFLRKLFQILLNNKDVMVRYNIKENFYWEKGKIKFVDKKIRDKGIMRVEHYITVETKNDRYYLFTNIKDLKISEDKIKDRVLPVLEIVQKMWIKNISSYFYSDDWKVKLFILRYLREIMGLDIGILKYLD